MSERPLYHEGSRKLQDRFGTRRLADKLEEHRVRTVFNDADREFIESRSFFFLATADAAGHPDCSYKGGMPGFVRILDANTLAFGNYDGNGMFRSLGNLVANPQVGLLFVDFERPRRLRVNGTASLDDDPDLVGRFEGAQIVVRVRPDFVFPNCPRYIHTLKLEEHSVYAPRPGHTPPVPGWKQSPEFRDVLPPSNPSATERT